MIPKIIHYCWFGHGKQSLLIKRCIASWNLRLPDYTFILWNEEKFDPCKYEFTKKAYDAKKYAFVSDYVRMFALNQHGGIYLDTDVEVFRSLSSLLNYDFFIGLEKENDFGTNVIGCKPDHWLTSEMLDLYNSTPFNKDDLKSMVNVSHVSKKLLARGFSGSDRKEIIDNNLALPIGYLSDASNLKKIIPPHNKYSRHHYAGSWKTNKKSFLSKTSKYIKRHAISDLVSIAKIAIYSARSFKKTQNHSTHRIK